MDIVKNLKFRWNIGFSNPYAILYFNLIQAVFMWLKNL